MRWLLWWRRWFLWLLLGVLVLLMLATLIWLAGRYEASQVQDRLERDASEAVADIRNTLARNAQSLQALQAGQPAPEAWALQADALLRERREILHLEWRDRDLQVLAQASSPYRAPVFEAEGRNLPQGDVALACAGARRTSSVAYSRSYFVPSASGSIGLEVVELCLPIVQAGRTQGYVLATYGLQEILASVVARPLTRGQEIAFSEVDGTRLAIHGHVRRDSRRFTAEQLLDLPGNTLVLRLNRWQGEAQLFPNLLTALVTAMSIALVTVLLLLAKDSRLRLRAEKELAEALAFRKAMENSLVTGLRARDLQGNITYVNPAFCQMVDCAAEELLGHNNPPPYWPPEHADEYRRRQDNRASGQMPPREGLESLFMRKDGSRFPVLIIEAPLINARGQHTGWMSAVLDISEQRRSEEISRASQERLQATARLALVGEMASLLSHELNQPLAAIASYASGSINLLQEPAGGGAGEVDEMLLVAMRRIAEQAERAGRVIKSVHDFVRRREQTRESVPPSFLLEAIEPLVRLQARKLGVDLQLRVAPGLPPVRCDRTMVEQVLLNLVRNGMQAMDNPGCQRRQLVIDVGPGPLESPHDWVTFAVRDMGVGIAEEVAAQLFTPFFTTKVEGMGLGLSLCRTVVEQHGGTLRHAAVQPQGTVFEFTLPTQPTSGET